MSRSDTYDIEQPALFRPPPVPVPDLSGMGQVVQQGTSFRDLHHARFGLSTSSWQVSEMVPGRGAYSQGLESSVLLPRYKGVGIRRPGASPIARTYRADGWARWVNAEAERQAEPGGRDAAHAGGTVVNVVVRQTFWHRG